MEVDPSWRKKKPLHERRQIIKQTLQSEAIDTFIETGTYMGDTVALLSDCCSEIHTVELDRNLFEAAQRRFAAQSHITVHHGDSATALGNILQLISGRALLFLDAHYSQGCTTKGSSETPILEELDIIASSPRHDHVIVIDDINDCANGVAGYPTIEEVVQRIHNIDPRYENKIGDGLLIAVVRS